MNKAVFLDRDGVINPLVYNILTGEYESPHCPEDFSIFVYVLKSLKLLKEMGYKIIIISNQPSFAKGKISLEKIKAIEDLLYNFSEENDTIIDDYYYCYHHPNGIVPEYTRKCLCRKPGTLFVEQAIRKHNLDPQKCYFIGDQDTDILCGNRMGMFTIKINNKHSMQKSGKEQPGEIVTDLYQAAQKIKMLDSKEFL
jgi:D-glycero-D-manno-heptose 1,7-bisphosphate phosphatase